MLMRPRRTRCSEPWPPPELRLPDTIEEIERGRPERVRQLDMLHDTPEARRARLTGSPAGETVPQDSYGCVSGGMVDTQDLGENQPLQGQLRGFDRA